MLRPQEQVGSYRILRFLGAGGMGSVYEAEHTAMGTRHALKVLGDQYVHSPGVRERFRREAQLMFRLGNHPHIVRATDLVDTAETMALVVDLVDGGDLGQALDARPGPLDWAERGRRSTSVVPTRPATKARTWLPRSCTTRPASPGQSGPVSTLTSPSANPKPAQLPEPTPNIRTNPNPQSPGNTMWTLPILLLAPFAAAMPLLPSSTDDGRGHVWTPDGKYETAKTGFTATLRSQGVSTFEVGNHCILEGKLTRIPNKAAWRFAGTSADGIGCPDTPGPASNMELLILDGPAVRAEGNASRIRVKHASQKRRMSFSGVYRYLDE
jgi:hypothetical protein